MKNFLRRRKLKPLRWRHIHIPKTAGTSIREYYTQGTECGMGHSPGKDFVDAEILKWAVIRDPFERLISICGHVFGALEKELGIETFQQWVAHDYPLSIRQGTSTKVMMGYVNDKHRFRITEPQVSFLTNDTWLLDLARIKPHLTWFLPKINLTYRGLPFQNVRDYVKDTDPDTGISHKASTYYEPVIVGGCDSLLDKVRKDYAADVRVYRAIQEHTYPVEYWRVK